MDERIESRRDQLLEKAVDDIFTLNSVLSFAVFIGLSQATPSSNQLEHGDNCKAKPGVSKLLIVFEVLAFTCFITSTLFVKVIKQHLNLKAQKYQYTRPQLDKIDIMFIMTAIFSVAGIGCLVTSVVFLIQIKIGLISCRRFATMISISSICVIVGLALVIYVWFTFKVVHGSITGDEGFYNAYCARHAPPLGTNDDQNPLVAGNGIDDSIISVAASSGAQTAPPLDSIVSCD